MARLIKFPGLLLLLVYAECCWMLLVMINACTAVDRDECENIFRDGILMRFANDHAAALFRFEASRMTADEIQLEPSHITLPLLSIKSIPNTVPFLHHHPKIHIN
jgi:hypothetical protein